MAIRWLRRYRRLVLWLLGTSFVPSIFLLLISYYQTIAGAQSDLEKAVEQSARRLSSLMRASEITLKELEISLENLSLNDSRAWKLLQRLAYSDPRFREIGIINEEGLLVLTSLGPVDPPIYVNAKIRADLSVKELQIIGPITTTLMQERSIVLALPTKGKGEINILVDPIVLSTYWNSSNELDLGPDGFLAYVNKQDQKIITGSGILPRDGRISTSVIRKQRLREVHPVDGTNVYIVGEVSKAWVLQKWRHLLLIGSPITILSSSILMFLLIRFLYPTQMLDYDIKIGLKNNEFELHY
ncbi:MAG: hypothetical protein F6J95_011685 [Leptolyngbya sp. SIO1E4]|nr:hypothetical protein [Leptolyngbya sp. SIO1E4]